jgi:hypothetical protein
MRCVLFVEHVMLSRHFVRVLVIGNSRCCFVGMLLCFLSCVVPALGPHMLVQLLVFQYQVHANIHGYVK